MNKPTYRLSFFFDYHCGGCLWSDNDASFEKFGVGVLDAESYDLNGIIIQEAKIKLPYSIRQSTIALDKLFAESLNWSDPGGASLWDKNQWDSFYRQTRDLHEEISRTLGDHFEVIYKQA